MKVVLVGAFPPQQKGEAVHLGQYAHALRGYLPPDDIAIVSQYENEPREEHWDGLRVLRAVRDRSRRPSYAPQRELVDAVSAAGADIVHVHYGPNQDYGGRLGEPLVGALRALRRRDIKVVLTLHSLWMPHDVIESAAAQRIPRPLRPLIVLYFGQLARALRSQCDALLCLVSGPQSPMTMEFAHAYRLRDLGEEVHGCALDFSPLPSGEPRIFSFGFLRPEKGFEVLIEAFCTYAKAGGAGTLTIAGRPITDEDRRYAKMLERVSAPYRERIRFLERYISDEDLAQFLRSANVVVLPYLRNIGSSGPLHAALGAGRPVIATAIGHNRALGDAVELIPAQSSDAIAQALRELFDSPGAQEIAAERAREAARRRSWGRVAEHHVALYRRLLS